MRQVLGWVAFVVVLVGLGVLIHAGARPGPRWRTALGGSGYLTRISPDGRRVAVIGFEGRFSLCHPPLRVLDAATGEEVASHWEKVDAPQFIPPRWSADGRWTVASAGARLFWLDEHGVERSRTFKDRVEYVTLADSAPSAFVVLHEEGREESGRLVCVDLEGGTVTPVLDDADLGLVLPSVPRRLALQDQKSRAVVLFDDRGRRLGAVDRPAEVFALTDEGRVLAMSVKDGPVELWDVSDPARPRRTVAVPDRSYDIIPGTGAVLTVGDGGPGAAAAEVWDGRSGRLLRRFTGPECLHMRIAALDPIFSSDGRWCVVWAGLGENYLIDLETGKLQAEFSRQGPNVQFLNGEGGRPGVLVRREEGTWFIEAESGRTFELPAVPFDVDLAPTLAASGRQLWQAGGMRPFAGLGGPGWWERFLDWLRPPPTDVLVGIEWPSRRPLLRLVNTGVNGYEVAADGSFLLTQHPTAGGESLCRWDLPPPKPWAWIVGVPLATGAALLALRAWWQRGRRRVQTEGEERPG